MPRDHIVHVCLSRSFGSRAVHREPLEALLVTRVSGQEQLETHVRRLLEHVSGAREL